MRTRREKRLLGAVALAIFAMLLLGTAEVWAQPPKGVLKMAIHYSLSADWLDPATCSYPVSANLPLYLMHDALVKPMSDGTYTPCLAESWSISPDAKVYEFRLRKGVKFHNGDILTAEDVVFSYWRYKGPQAKFLQSRTEKVEAVNPQQVRYHFKEPFPDFLEYFPPGTSTIGWIVPKKYVQEVGDAGFKKHPIGAGPYKFVEFTPGTKLVGEAFEGFWRKVPKVKRLEFHTVTDGGTRFAMVKRGEVDIALIIQDVFYEAAQKTPGLTVLKPLSPTIYTVFMPAQWDPKSPWSDPRVRLAASLALDRKTLADMNHPGCDPASSIGLPGDPLVVNFPAHPYNPEQGKKLLAEAGFSKGFHGGKLYPYGGNWQWGEQIATYWKAIGINVDVVLLERPAWIAAHDSGKFKADTFVDAILAPTLGGRLSYLFGPTSYGNYPDIQALWEQYQRETEPKARKDLIARIQNLIYERNMWLPLTLVNAPNAQGPRVKGNPYKVQPLIWYPAPFEDIEMNE